MSQADELPPDLAMARAAAAAASAEQLVHDIDDAVRSEQADNLIKSYVFAAGVVPASVRDLLTAG